MKRTYKITAWIVGCIVLICACVIGVIIIKNLLNPDFKETKIYPKDNGLAPIDTVIDINGIAVKMIGVKGGKIDCKGLKETIELDDFYIGETEVTQELWSSIMDHNPSVHQPGDSLPVENIDLVECLEFVHKLDSVSGHNFYIPTYPQWLYAGYLSKQLPTEDNALDSHAWYRENAENVTHSVKHKNPNALGVYDMLGNVAEWTISGSDPLFIVAGGGYDTEKDKLYDEHREFDHCNVKTGSLGLRLILYPDKPKK
ncbi:MAG: formylglycine-generating enzyme family protein [Muribaculaceae bacterium]|nr:formylglycine-generating enzyme family protein [Muribaculaceae bacterium]